MKEKYSRIKPYKKFLIRSIPLYVLTFIVMLISAFSFGLYAEYVKDDKTVAMNNIVYAEIDEILPIPIGATSPGNTNNWEVYYTYEDGEFRYRGHITVAGEATAKSYLGTKIPIYIDGKGYNIAVAKYSGSASTQDQLIYAILILIFFIFLIFISIYLFLRKRKEIKIVNNQDV